MFMTGDFIRIRDPHPLAGATGVLERCGIHDLTIRLTATGQAITVRRDQVRREFGVPVTIATTLARREGQAA